MCVSERVRMRIYYIYYIQSILDLYIFSITLSTNNLFIIQNALSVRNRLKCAYISFRSFITLINSHLSFILFSIVSCKQLSKTKKEHSTRITVCLRIRMLGQTLKEEINVSLFM